MKKIIKPAVLEQSEYFCDFSGEKLVDYIPAEVKFSCGYGSQHDGFYLNLDLSDEAAEELLEFIKNKLSTQTKGKLKKKLEQVDNQYFDAMDARSWDECERYGNHKHLLQYLSKSTETIENKDVILFSERYSIAQAAAKWCQVNNAAITPLGIITALYDMGRLK